MGLPNLTDSGQNPADIAQAIANQVEAESNTIAGLKAQAQADQDYIQDFLRVQAQADHDAIQALYDNISAKRHHYTSFTSPFIQWSVSGQTSSDSGIFVQNIGVIWIVNMGIEGPGVGTGQGNVNLLNISNEFTNPSSTVIMGMQHFGNTGENEYMASLQLSSSGNLNLYYLNGSGSTMHCIGTFIGLDIG